MRSFLDSIIENSLTDSFLNFIAFDSVVSVKYDTECLNALNKKWSTKLLLLRDIVIVISSVGLKVLF